MTLAAEHACTVTVTPEPTRVPWQATGTLLTRVSAGCSCGMWLAEGVVNVAAPAYDDDALPTYLRRLHRDHQADVLLDPAGAEAETEAEWDAVLATLGETA